MTNSINYKDTLFKRANLTPILGEPTIKTLYKLQNKIKANTKAVYYNIGVGSHGHLGIVLINSQYALILPTPFIYLTHPSPLIIMEITTAQANSNMRIKHTKEVRLFREVIGFEKSLLQQIVVTVQETYIAHICNRMANYINNIVADVINHLQETFGQLMPHKLFERKEIVKKTTYHPQDRIAIVFSAVKELPEFTDIPEKSYTHLKDGNVWIGDSRV